MAGRMRLVPLDDIGAEEWDRAVAGRETAHLFHGSDWLSFLENIQPCRVLRCRIEGEGKTIGYFAGCLTQKGPFRILGSPLPGTTTEYLGPAADVGFDYAGFLEALEHFCRERRVHHLELCNSGLPHQAMADRGFRWDEDVTYIVDLAQPEEALWASLKKKSCRYSINRARREGLAAEPDRSPGFVEAYYKQLGEVFGRQGLAPTYAKDRVEQLFQNLGPDKLLPLAVKKGGETLATGIFVHDGRRMFFWGGASWSKYHHLCPNELLHWQAMLKAKAMGIRYYEMGGGGSFKPKFGGTETKVYRYYKSYSTAARWARAGYRLAVRARQWRLGAGREQ